MGRGQRESKRAQNRSSFSSCKKDWLVYVGSIISHGGRLAQSPGYFLHPWQRGLYRVRALQARAKDISAQYRIVLCLVCLLVILPRLKLYSAREGYVAN
jgi:hypothetical protein